MPTSMADELTLSLAGRELSGWTQVRVSRGIERCPSDFEIGLTERYPGEASTVDVLPGDACTVWLGDDLVLTGYIDRVSYAVSASQHTVSVTGRGKCADLVDCSAEWPNCMIGGADALGIAQKLAAPYGITVSAPGDTGARVQQFNLMLGETAFEIIERVCRWGALLAYDEPDGNLVLSRSAQVSAASGFTQGLNVQDASLTYSSDQRYSEYKCVLQSMLALGELGDAVNTLAIAKDVGVRRNRKRIFITESPGADHDFQVKRAQWESNRRLGRSSQLRVVTDSWRDTSATLWTPNTLVPLALPALKCGTETEPERWLVTEVSYRRDMAGTTCELTIMPPEAFQPMPIYQLRGLAELATDTSDENYSHEGRR